MLHSALLGLIQNACESVLILVEQLPREELMRSRLTRTEVQRQLATLAASVAQIEPEQRATMPELDWSGWALMRVQLAGPPGETLDEALWIILLNEMSALERAVCLPCGAGDAAGDATLTVDDEGRGDGLRRQHLRWILRCRSQRRRSDNNHRNYVAKRLTLWIFAGHLQAGVSRIIFEQRCTQAYLYPSTG